MYACRINIYRECKFWNPVYLWIIRKRVDRSYEAKILAWKKACVDMDKRIADGRVGPEKREELQAEKKEMLKKKPEHFAFIENAAKYRIIQVRCSLAAPHPPRRQWYARPVSRLRRSVHPRACRRPLSRFENWARSAASSGLHACALVFDVSHHRGAIAVAVVRSQGYNAVRPAALHLTSVNQWRRALEAGPLTCAKRGGKEKAKGKRVPSSSAAAGGSETAEEATKRVRGAKYSPAPDGEVPWPPSRLNFQHRPASHPPGSNNTFCDYPLCFERARKDAVAGLKSLQAAGGVASPRSAAMPPPPPRTQGRDTGSSSATGRASPAPSNASSTSTTASGRNPATKMFCKDCYDPTGSRPMNFHPECWCAWHGLNDDDAMDVCPPADP